MKEAYKKLYEEFLESDNESAPQEVKESYSEIGNAFEQYLCAVQEEMFRKAFEFGYAKGVEVAKRKKTA